jgi:hypothetical protein
MTIQEYAAKWAVVEFNSDTAGCPESHRTTNRQIFFEWAVRDEDSPIHAALASGEPEESVQEQFDAGFNNMLAILTKMS